MKIDSCSFGAATLEGVTYEKDAIILSDKVVAGRRRKDGHRLSIKDLDRVAALKPDALIAGTGAHGEMAIECTVRE